MNKRHLAALAAISCGLATPASAATLLVDGSGKLTGANGVNVGGTLYNVVFKEGTCSTVFGGCDANSDFDFQTEAGAVAAAQALMEQVFIDSDAGQFDTVPSNTSGCSSSSSCEAWVPYEVLVGVNYLRFGIANNDATSIGDGFGSAGDNRSENTTSLSFATFADFSLMSSPVPEPSSWAMMIVGFGMLGSTMRRAKRGQRRTVLYT